MTTKLSCSAVFGLAVVLTSGVAFAQNVQIFPDRAALNDEIAQHMGNGTFSALVGAVAPPSLMTPGRVRSIESSFGDDPPTFEQSAVIFADSDQDGVQREVTAWWDGEAYVYIGTMTHTRDEDLAVLDFLLTGDLRRASRWYLTGNPEQ